MTEVVIYQIYERYIYKEMIYHDLVHHTLPPELENKFNPDGWWLSWRECACMWARSVQKKYLEARMGRDLTEGEIEMQRSLGAGLNLTPERFKDIYITVKQQWRDRTLEEKIARIRELQEAITVLRVNEQAVYSEYEEEIGELPEELRKKVSMKGPKPDQSEKLISDLMTMMSCDRDMAVAILKSQGK